MRHMKVPDYSYWVSSSGEDDCGTKCSQNCSCLAYAYYPGIGCMMWNVSLMDIQQFSADGADLFIRLAQLGESGKSKLIIITIMGTFGATTLVLFIYYGCKRIRQLNGLKNTNKLDLQLYNILDDRVEKEEMAGIFGWLTGEKLSIIDCILFEEFKVRKRKGRVMGSMWVTSLMMSLSLEIIAGFLMPFSLSFLFSIIAGFATVVFLFFTIQVSLYP